MAYHPLTSDTGQTPERRREEAVALIKMIDESYEQLTDREKEMVEGQRYAEETSPKQLLYLRDIKDRYE